MPSLKDGVDQHQAKLSIRHTPTRSITAMILWPLASKACRNDVELPDSGEDPSSGKTMGSSHTSIPSLPMAQGDPPINSSTPHHRASFSSHAFGMDSFQYSSILATGLASCAVYVFVCLAYRLYLSPLARFPGPRLAALTSWYEFYYDCVKRGRFTFKIAELHRQYGRSTRCLIPCL